jgi:hypothetical protein
VNERRQEFIAGLLIVVGVALVLCGIVGYSGWLIWKSF